MGMCRQEPRKQPSSSLEYDEYKVYSSFGNVRASFHHVIWRVLFSESIPGTFEVIEHI